MGDISSSEEESLEREYKVAKDRLRIQHETLQAFGENATKMLRIILLLLGAIVAGVLNFGITSDLYMANVPLTILTFVGFFAAIFLLVSGTLGVGTANYQLANKGDLEDVLRTVPENEEHLTRQLWKCKTRIEKNEDVIAGNRRLMLYSDGLLSISFGLLTLIFLTAIDPLYGFLAPFLVIITLGFMYTIDREFPPSHEAKIIGDGTDRWRIISIFVTVLLSSILIPFGYYV